MFTLVWMIIYSLLFLLGGIYSFSTVTPKGNTDLTPYKARPPAIVNENYGTFFISTLDGKLHAVDVTSGEYLWVFATDGPLIRSPKDMFPSRDSEETSGGVVLPGVDGSLFYTGPDGILTHLPTTLDEMVKAAPYWTSDGTMFNGAKHTVSYMLDKATGRVLHVSSDEGYCPDDIEDLDVVWIAHTIHSVKAFDMKNRRGWNVSVASFTTPTVQGEQREPPVSLDNLPKMLASVGGGVYALVDGSPPRVLWSHQLDSPVASIHYIPRYQSRGTGVHKVPHVYFVPTDSSPHLSPDKAMIGTKPHGTIDTELGLEDINLDLNDTERDIDPDDINLDLNDTERDEDMRLQEEERQEHRSQVLMDHFLRGQDVAQSEKQVMVRNGVAVEARIVQLYVTTTSDGSLVALNSPVETDIAYGSSNAPNQIVSSASASSVAKSPSVLCLDNSSCMVGKIQALFPSFEPRKDPTEYPVKAFYPFHSHIGPPLSGPSASGPSLKNDTSDHSERTNKSFLETLLIAITAGVCTGVMLLGIFWVWVRPRLERMTSQPKIDETSPSLVGSSTPTSDTSLSPVLSSPISRNASPVLTNSNSTTQSRSESPSVVGPGEHSIGKILVALDVVLGTGSMGTVVYAGKFEGRPVAIKRMVKTFYGANNADKEIALLIDSDQHPNVLRYYSREEDEHFVYLALERGTGSLNDLVNPSSSPSKKNRNKSKQPPPSATVLNLLHNMLSGLAHLHALNIVHRDLKPHNILLGGDSRAMIADMGLGKKLDRQRSSFDSQVSRSTGWSAPELVEEEDEKMPTRKRLTKAVDVFSAGCVLFYVVTNGQHPFGSNVERDVNILKWKCKLKAVEHLPEAFDLVGSMVVQDPDDRLTAEECSSHPLFWTDEMKLQFLQDVSDRIESEPVTGPLRTAMERDSKQVVGADWSQSLCQGLLDNLTKFRKYEYGSVRDCLRIIRNKRNHYRDLPPEVQTTLGTLPSGFLHYFLSRFPRLLLHTYFVIGSFLESPLLSSTPNASVDVDGSAPSKSLVVTVLTSTFGKYYHGLTVRRLRQFQNIVLGKPFDSRQWYPTLAQWVSSS